jgi:hypothetical protein
VLFLRWRLRPQDGLLLPWDHQHFVHRQPWWHYFSGDEIVPANQALGPPRSGQQCYLVAAQRKGGNPFLWGIIADDFHALPPRWLPWSKPT